ncbi:hypothetical protein PGB90_010459 [Kerria lacca]
MDIESFPDEQRQKGLSNSKPPHYRQKARGNNYRTGKIEVTREKFGKLKLENPHRERELRLFLDSRPTIDKIPITQPLGLTDASLTSRSLILPYSITGLSFAGSGLLIKSLGLINLAEVDAGGPCPKQTPWLSDVISGSTWSTMVLTPDMNFDIWYHMITSELAALNYGDLLQEPNDENGAINFDPDNEKTKGRINFVSTYLLSHVHDTYRQSICELKLPYEMLKRIREMRFPNLLSMRMT